MISKGKWSIWLFLTLAGFFMLEIPAIQNAVPGDTLSEYVWSWGGYRFLVVGFLAWLLVHFGWRV